MKQFFYSSETKITILVFIFNTNQISTFFSHLAMIFKKLFFKLKNREKFFNVL